MKIRIPAITIPFFRFESRAQIVFCGKVAHCFSDGKKLSTANIKETTGIEVEKTQPNTALTITVDSSLVKNYTFSHWNSVLNPMFIVTDPKAENMVLITNSTQIGFCENETRRKYSMVHQLRPGNSKIWHYIFKRCRSKCLPQW